ncbi:tetratricopeptide repeat protein [Micromonospora sonchi]|nr:tetratricopeptide repeat protein [Micromonospora sonchi]
MTADPGTDLVAEADAAYSRVVLDPARYTAAAGEIVELARRTGNDEALIAGLRALAWTRHAILDNETAKSLLDQAARLATRNGLHRRLGEVLLTRSVALQELGRYPAATRDLRRAANLVSSHQRPELLMQLAILDHNAGRVLAAARQYRLVLAEPACPPVIWVKAANNLSYAQTQLGRPQAALAYLDRAASLASELGPMLSAVIENSRAWSSFHAGRFTESLRGFEEAGRLYTAAGLPLGEHYLDYTDALAELRLLDEAAAVARLAAADLERHGARLMAAEARLRCARLALALGDTGSARADARSAPCVTSGGSAAPLGRRGPSSPPWRRALSWTVSPPWRYADSVTRRPHCIVSAYGPTRWRLIWLPGGRRWPRTSGGGRGAT